jgi:4-amino-4-deoxychorismate lyase
LIITASYSEAGWRVGPLLADRGQEFGDGVFETLRLTHDLTFPLGVLHKQRLCRGLVRLDFPIDTLRLVDVALGDLGSIAGLSALREEAERASRNIQLKLIVSRQLNHSVSADAHQWPRGYQIGANHSANLQIQLRLAPAWNQWVSGWCVGVNPLTLADQPLLAGVKHLNRLEQVMARHAFAADWQESLMLNRSGDVIEGCMSNIYLLEGDRLVTPILDNSGVEGIAKQWLLQQADSLDVVCQQGILDVRRIYAADGLLFSNTLNGFSWAKKIDDFEYSAEKQQLAQRVQQRIQSMFISMFSSGNSDHEN